MEKNHSFLQTGGQPVSDRMRELLARAAQEHVYEQRSNGQVLDDIRQRIEGMEWLLREVREGGLNGLAEHIEAVGERVKPVAELPALWADVGVMAENVDEGLAKIQMMIESAERIADATRQTAQRLEEMSKRLDRLQGSMEAASVRFNRLDKSLAELGHRMERLDHAVGAVAGRVDHALGDMADRVEQGLDAVNGRVEGVGGRLDGLDGRLEGLSGKLTGLDGRVEGRLDSVDDRVAHLPAVLEIGRLHSTLTELAQRPAFDHDHRFDALEKHLVDSADDVTRHMSAVHETMLKRLSTLEETMLALAEALLRPRRDDKD